MARSTELIECPWVEESPRIQILFMTGFEPVSQSDQSGREYIGAKASAEPLQLAATDREALIRVKRLESTPGQSGLFSRKQKATLAP